MTSRQAKAESLREALEDCKNDVEILEQEKRWAEEAEAKKEAQRVARNARRRAKRAADKFKPKKPKASAAEPSPVVAVSAPAVGKAAKEIADAIEDAPAHVSEEIKKHVSRKQKVSAHEAAIRAAEQVEGLFGSKGEQKADPPPKEIKVDIPVLDNFRDAGIRYFAVIDRLPETTADRDKMGDFIEELNPLAKINALNEAADEAEKFIDSIRERIWTDKIKIQKIMKELSGDSTPVEPGVRPKGSTRPGVRPKGSTKKSDVDEKYKPSNIPKTDEAVLLVRAFMKYWSALHSGQVPATKAGTAARPRANKPKMKQWLKVHGIPKEVIEALMGVNAFTENRGDRWKFSIGGDDVFLAMTHLDAYRDLGQARSSAAAVEDSDEEKDEPKEKPKEKPKIRKKKPKPRLKPGISFYGLGLVSILEEMLNFNPKAKVLKMMEEDTFESDNSQNLIETLLENGWKRTKYVDIPNMKPRWGKRSMEFKRRGYPTIILAFNYIPGIGDNGQSLSWLTKIKELEDYRGLSLNRDGTIGSFNMHRYNEGYKLSQLLDWVDAGNDPETCPYDGC